MNPPTNARLDRYIGEKLDAAEPRAEKREPRSESRKPSAEKRKPEAGSHDFRTMPRMTPGNLPPFLPYR